MSKSPLRMEQEVVDADATVTEAADWADLLLQRTYRGPGDTIEAASYRKPSGILAHIYLRLKAAYEHECERQEARLRHELEMAKALQGGATLAAAISEAEAALGGGQHVEDPNDYSD